MYRFIGTSNTLNRSGPAAFTKIDIFAPEPLEGVLLFSRDMTHAVLFGPKRQVS
jgi:hypothetical protein